MGRYSERKVEVEDLLGMGVMLAHRQQNGKLPDLMNNLNATANLGAKMLKCYMHNKVSKIFFLCSKTHLHNF